MNLWIRSQSKLSLIRPNNICIRGNSNVIVSYSDNLAIDNYITLGSYKTKERVLEVLNEIQEQLENVLNYDHMESKVYIMPEE